MKCLLYLACAIALDAQTFEVASVKPSTPGGGGVRGGCHGIDSKYSRDQPNSPPPLGRCVITGARLSHLIDIAYDLPNQGWLEAAPAWVLTGNERFIVEGKAEDQQTATEGQLLKMLQTLLADRFKLKFRWETREMSGVALVVAKGGPKFSKATDEEMGFKWDSDPLSSGAPVSFRVRSYTMPMLATLLSASGAGHVADMTGLAGAYEFKLSWNETDGPSLATALQEQLGLRLESRKVPVKFFIFESAERPAEN